MKAYELSRGVKAIILDGEVLRAPNTKPVYQSDEIQVISLDGAFVKCFNQSGDIIYISANTNVSEIN